MDSHLEPLLRELMGAELRAERHRLRRTLAEVAAAAGVSMQHLSDVERGRKDPSSELLAAILGALGLELAQVLRRAAEGAPASSRSDRRDARVLELRSAPVGHGSAAAPGSVVAMPGADVRLLAAA